MSYNVFVSYSTKDIQLVNNLKQMLSHPPVETFIAEYSVHPGGNLKPEILEAIRSCDLFVVLWSNYSRSSEWVPQEIGVAVSEEKTILPVVLSPSLTLPGFIKDRKYLDVSQKPDNSLQSLQENIYNRAQKKQKKDGLVWLVLGGAFLWLLNQSDDEKEIQTIEPSNNGQKLNMDSA